MTYSVKTTIEGQPYPFTVKGANNPLQALHAYQQWLWAEYELILDMKACTEIHLALVC